MHRKPSIENPIRGTPFSFLSTATRELAGELKDTVLSRANSGSSGVSGMQCQNLPSSRDASEGEEAARLLSRLSLSHSASTLHSEPIPPRNSLRKSSLASQSSENTFLSGFAVSEKKVGQREEGGSDLGESILGEQKFREQLEMLIMGHLQ